LNFYRWIVNVWVKSALPVIQLFSCNAMHRECNVMQPVCNAMQHALKHRVAPECLDFRQISLERNICNAIS